MVTKQRAGGGLSTRGACSKGNEFSPNTHTLQHNSYADITIGIESMVHIVPQEQVISCTIALHLRYSSQLSELERVSFTNGRILLRTSK